MQRDQLHDRLLDLDEAAVYLHVSKWTLRRLVDSGIVPAVRLRGRGGAIRRLLFDKADLRALIAESKTLTINAHERKEGSR